MEENEQLFEKEQLIKSAIEKVKQGGDTNLKLAIWELQKSIDKPFRYPNSPEGKEIYANNKANAYRFMIETLTGFENSKERLICQLLEMGNIGTSMDPKSIMLMGVEKVRLRSFAHDFLFDQLSEMWLKSLKYDEILKVIENSGSVGDQEKSQIKKINSILVGGS